MGPVPDRTDTEYLSPTIRYRSGLHALSCNISDVVKNQLASLNVAKQEDSHKARRSRFSVGSVTQNCQSDG